MSLPAWTSTLAGFDPEYWWRPIVCTHGTGRLAEADVLGVVFVHASFGVMWSGGPVHKGDDIGIAYTRIWATDETSPEDAELIGELRGEGSIYVRCSRGCTPRIPASQWEAIVRDEPLLERLCLDVSRY